MALRLNGADKFRCLLRPLDVLTVSSRERACACTQSDWSLQMRQGALGRVFGPPCAPRRVSGFGKRPGPMARPTVASA